MGTEARPFLPLALHWASSMSCWGLCWVGELPALVSLPHFFGLPALAEAGIFFPSLTSVLPQHPVQLHSSCRAMQPTLCIKFPSSEVLTGFLPTQLDPGWTRPFLRMSKCSVLTSPPPTQFHHWIRGTVSLKILLSPSLPTAAAQGKS